MQTYTPSLTSQTKTGVGPFNPGRVNVAGDEFQNGDSAAHHSPGKRGWSPPRVNASGPPCRLVIIVSGATLLSLFTEDVNSVAV